MTQVMPMQCYGRFFASTLLVFLLTSSSATVRSSISPMLRPLMKHRQSNRHTAVLSTAAAFPRYRTWEDNTNSMCDFGVTSGSKTQAISSWTAAWPSLPTIPSIRTLSLPRLPTFLRRRSTESTLQAVTDAFAACGSKLALRIECVRVLLPTLYY